MRKTVSYLIMLLIPIGVIETASYFSLIYLEQRNLTRFDVQRYAQSHMSEEGYKNARSDLFDPDLGWVNRPNTKRTEKTAMV